MVRSRRCIPAVHGRGVPACGFRYFGKIIAVVNITHTHTHRHIMSSMMSCSVPVTITVDSHHMADNNTFISSYQKVKGIKHALSD